MRCGHPALDGKRRCRMHPGREGQAGVSNPNYKGGRYSKVMPSHLRATYELAIRDPDLLSARSEISILVARIEQLLGQIGDGGGLRLWVNLLEEVQKLGSGLRSGDPQKAMAASVEGYRRLDALCRKGVEQETVWAEIYRVAELHTKMKDSEWKRMVALKQLVTAEQAIAIITAISRSVLLTLSSFGDQPGQRRFNADEALDQIGNDVFRVTGGYNMLSGPREKVMAFHGITPGGPIVDQPPATPDDG